MTGTMEQKWTVRDVMSEDVLTASPDMPFKVLVEQLVLGGVSGVPVVDDGRVVGVVSGMDLLRREELGSASAATRWIHHLSRLTSSGDSDGLKQVLAELRKAMGLTAGDVMTSPAVTIGPDASLAAAAGLMHRHDLKRLPVVDGAGRLVGIVTRTDLLKIFMLTDGAIERFSREVLTSVLGQTEAVRVSVQDGVVTLAGEVEARPEAEAVVTRVEALPGVVGVEDHLRTAV